ncbi:tyrosine-type recombinase/integrase [Candidatus Bipolaricaulota bacterium]|nr:tyrosine-type recombinase/integrase [Candidatus Bipolaricaulota bacterium]
MNWRKQAYGSPPKNHDFSDEREGKKAIPQLRQDATLDEAVEDFTLMAKVEGRADQTLKLYDYVFENFSEAVGEKTQIGDIEKRDVRKYLANLMDDGLKNTSVAIHHRVLNAFFTWLVDDSYINKSPTEDVKEPKTPSKFPKCLDEEQVDELLEAARSRKREWSGYRNYAMLIVFLDTGLRLDEFVNATLEDLDMKRRSIKVHGKGAKDRKVFFGKRTFNCLRHWLRIREKVDKVWDDTIFISQNGDKLKKRNVQRLITRIQDRAGLEDVQVSPHVLRHTAATFAVQNGLDAFSLKRQFGWEQMRTALRYVHMSDKALQESYNNSSPMDNFES